jgi:threonine/homoserine/homoserine lactone efflux protein
MTETFSLFIRGFIIGISIAAPVGPIGILCIRRTLSDGKLAGFLSGLGAATADMIYGAIAAFGLTVIMKLLIDQAYWLGLLGGVFMLYLGARTFFSRPADQPAQLDNRGLVGAYFSILFLTLTNPMTIISFIGIFAGAMPRGTHDSPFVLVAGIFAGSAFWWLALSFGVGMMQDRMKPDRMLWLNRLSGTVIMIFGVISLWNVMQG